MREQFALVKHACDFQAVLDADAAVTVKEGRLQAKNAIMAVSIPVDAKDFSVTGVDLDFAFRKVPDAELSVGASYVTLKSKNGNTRLKRLSAEREVTKPDIETSPIADPEDLGDALDDVWPFTEGHPSRPWSSSARFDGCRITATNSTVLLRSELRQSSGLHGVTLPRAVVDYIRLRRADLEAWGHDKRSVLLEFRDGSWAHAARMNPEMPDQAVHMVDSVNDWTGLQSIGDQYRSAFMSAVGYSDGFIEINPNHIYTTLRHIEHSESLDTNLGDLENSALFGTKDLTAVMSRAQEIGFDRYPSPVPFRTARGSLGLIAGRTRQE